jgi:hypothetical protein
VFLLYTVIPQLERLGLVYFKYLTIMPVVEECYPHMVQRDLGAAVQAVQNMLPSAKFFNLDFPQVVFTLLSQGVLILTMMMMLWRRWRRDECHLLGKAWAVGLFGWIQLVLLGNALPLIEPGHLFPSRGLDRLARRFRLRQNWEPEDWEPVVMAGVFGVVTLIMLWVLTIMITPNEERRLRGWRRARKLGRRGLSPFSDPSSAFPWVVVMVVLGGLGWHAFAEALYGSRWFPGQDVPEAGRWAFLLVMATGGLGFHALLEGKGARATGMAVIFLGLVPLMIGTVVAVISERLAAPAVWLIGISPGAAPVYGATAVLPQVDLPQDLLRAVPRAFWFWQAVGALATVRLIYGLRQSLKKVAKQAEGE